MRTKRITKNHDILLKSEEKEETIEELVMRKRSLDKSKESKNLRLNRRAFLIIRYSVR
jgi:hypothetical protein